MSGLIEFLQNIPRNIENIPYNPIAYGLISAGSQMGANPRAPFSSAGSGLLSGLENAQQNKMTRQQFELQQQLAPLIQAVQLMKAQQAMQQVQQPYNKPTIGPGFIPQGAEKEFDKDTGGWYWNVPGLGKISDRSAMTQYQQMQTDPKMVGAISGARERARQAERGVEVQTDKGSYYAPLKDLNPSFGQAWESDDLVDTILGLIQKESNFNPNARGKKGEVGLSQILPSTARQPGFGTDPMKDMSVDEQVRFTVDHLSNLINYYNGDIGKAIQAWNPGAGQSYVDDVKRNAAKIAEGRRTRTFTPPAVETPSGIVYGISPADKKRQEAIGEIQGKVSASLADVNESAEFMINTIDQALNHPGLEYFIGPASIAGLERWPGTQAANYAPLFEELQGKLFEQAYEKLRGAGQITEFESQSAAKAIKALSRKTDAKTYRKALNDLKIVVYRLKQRALIKSGQAPIESLDQFPMPETSPPGQKTIEFMGFE